MKFVSKWLLIAACFLALLPSCTVLYSNNSEYGQNLAKVLPKPADRPKKVELEYQYAYVYEHSVYLHSKSGTTYPIELWVDDLTKNGRFDSAFERSGGPDSWRVYNASITEPGIRKIPDSMSREEAQDYFRLAVKAKTMIPKPKPVITRGRPVTKRSPLAQKSARAAQPSKQEMVPDNHKPPKAVPKHQLEEDGWRRVPDVDGRETWMKST